MVYTMVYTIKSGIYHGILHHWIPRGLPATAANLPVISAISFYLKCFRHVVKGKDPSRIVFQKKYSSIYSIIHLAMENPAGPCRILE